MYANAAVKKTRAVGKGNRGGPWQQLAVLAVTSELVSDTNSLVTGGFTGNFLILGRHAAEFVKIDALFQ